MQPYFLPYVGYWRLMAEADLFVILDDVNYSRGWINRNRIRNLEMSRWLTVPLHKSSQNRQICEHRIAFEAAWRVDHERRIKKCARRGRSYPRSTRSLSRSGCFSHGESGGIFDVFHKCDQ